MLNKEHNTRS